MGQHVAVAKAAQLLGISRHDLQALIRRGELTTFEGQLDLAELQLRYPRLALDGQGLYEDLKLIRTTAFSRRVRDVVAPDTDELASQLKRCGTERAMEKGKAAHYRAILEELAQMLCDLQETEDAAQRDTAVIVSRWLLQRLEA
jgi:CDP-4-dehydro-6-deoxyglucose reductase